MRYKLVAMGLLVVLLVTSVGTAFAQEDLPLAADPNAQVCYPWWNEPWYSDVNGNGLWEERYWPLSYGGFGTPLSSGFFDAKLGDIVQVFFPLFNPDGFPATFWPVDVYLWRPPTILECEDGEYKYWSLVMNPQKVDSGWPAPYDFPSWFAGAWDNPDGPRRQSWPAYQETDIFGFYYAKFMLPRDEVWFPCGYPCKWQCNGYNPWTDTYTWHSPWLTAYSYPPAVPFTPEWYYPLMYPMYWPYKWDALYGWVGDMFDAESSPWWYMSTFTDPQDTTHPLTIWLAEGVFDTYIDTWDAAGTPPWAEVEVTGYTWKTSDLKWAQWPDDWPYLCEDHRWYP